MTSSAHTFTNFILATLPEREMRLVEPHLVHVSVPAGHIVQEAGAAVDDMYFVESGMISVIFPMVDGGTAEVWVVGNEGVTSPLAALAPSISRVSAVGQISGTAHRMPSDVLRRLTHHCPELNRLLIDYLGLTADLVSATAACNSHHEIPQRLARWLLLTALITQSKVMPLTQEFLAQMITARRPSVTTAALSLQEAGFISYGRKRIEIIDEAGLRGFACECFETLESYYRDYKRQL